MDNRNDRQNRPSAPQNSNRGDIRKPSQSRGSDNLSQNRNRVQNSTSAGARRQPQQNKPSQPPKRNIPSPRERELMRQKKQMRKDSVSLWFILFAFSLICMIIVFAAVGAIALNNGKEGKDTTAPVKYPPLSTTSPVTDDPPAIGVQTVNFSLIAEMCEFSVLGTEQSVIYSFESLGYIQKIELTYGSDKANINGTLVTLEAPAEKDGESLFVPVSFVLENIKGISVTYDEEKKVYNIDREKDYGATPDIFEYLPITLKYASAEPVLPADDPYDDPIEFISDLSAYEQYMEPEDRDGYLILVNKVNTVSSDFDPGEILPLVNTRYPENQQYMEETSAKAIEAMFIELKANGFTDLSVTSAYRSYAMQNWFYEKYIDEEMTERGISREEAIKIVDTYSARPGTSEHQTGLCCDMHNIMEWDSRELEDFIDEPACKWLMENCWKFGFILRFPEDKVDITGYQFECWHYRFVGRYHARRIYEGGLCLEEYLEKLGNN